MGKLVRRSRGFSFISTLVFCTACTAAPSRAADTISVPEGPRPPAATAESSATAIPSSTEASLLPLPSPGLTFDVVIDNVKVGPQDQLDVSGFSSLGDDLRHFARWDGTRWIELGTGFRTSGNSMTEDAAGGLYTEILTDSSQGSSTAIIRWDGDKWEDFTGNFKGLVDAVQPGRVSSNIPVTSLAVDREGNLYAAGTFNYQGPGQATETPMGYVAKWNGETWTLLGSGFDNANLFALAASANGEVYVSGEQPLTAEGKSGIIAKWDGAGWTQIGPQSPDIILKLALDRTGGLYVAGQKQAGGAFVDYWDGKHWTSIASQFEGDAPAIFDLAVDPNEDLCIGGSFESVNVIPASNIACWDGDSWHALGSGVNERVEGIASDSSGNLYAVGFFTEAGGLPVDHVARWDGHQWHSLFD
jgi:hypothetical protein